MPRAYHIWVLGGDLRQSKLAELLIEDGHTVHTFGLEALPEANCVPIAPDLGGARCADCVILPLPVSQGEGLLHAPMAREPIALETIFSALRPNQIICGGRVDADTACLAAAHGLTLRDYFSREELVVANAVPTAEGAVQIALEELPITLHGARVLVLGFGRVAKLTAHRFAALGARVTAAARKWPDLAWAEAYGYESTHFDALDGFLCGYDLVVNTVPTCVLNAARLADLRADCLVIDLASKPGGVDFDAAKELGLRVIWALSLPGKVAPVTSGKIIRDTVYHILNELGV